jgi:hypothetical protein
MPYKDLTTRREYDKKYKRKTRESKNALSNQTKETNKTNVDIHYYEHTGLPITATLKDGSIIYIKKRVRQSII